MFIKVESGNILNTAHYSLFEIEETENEACIIASAAFISDANTRYIFDRCILTCDNKDEARKALDDLLAHIETGSRTWDAINYKKRRNSASQKNKGKYYSAGLK